MILLTSMVCLSTVFGYSGDKHGGRTPTVLTGKPVRWYDIGIAHRTWPMGSRVKITNIRTNISVFGVVLDRGPYGKKDPKGVWFNSRQPKENRSKFGVFQGCADLTPTLAFLIGHNQGREKIRVTLIRKK